MTINSSRWYVVQTQVNSENKAAANLLRQGYEVYLPRYWKRRRHARRVETVPVPLFPRYLFVGFDPMTARWRSIQSTFGVSHCPQQIEPGEPPDRGRTNFAGAKTTWASSGLDLPHEFPGDKICVVDGVFSADSVGLFEE